MAIELYYQLTSELSKLENELVNNSICSYESQIQDMSEEEIHAAAQELLWMAQEMNQESMQFDDEEFDMELGYKDDVIEEAERLLEEIAGLL